MKIEKVLMCEPTYFDIEYVINPWMDTNNRVDKRRARAQWENVRDVLTRLGVAIEYIAPEPGLPDMTFIGDAGMVNGKTFAASHFRHHQRQREAVVTSEWMRERGYEVIQAPENVFFEGLGDVIYSDTGIIIGHGPRSSPESVEFIKQLFPGLRVDGEVHLCDPWFYHTALAAAFVGEDKIIYYSPALTAESRKFLEGKFEHRIEISEQDAKEFMVCNNIVVGQNILVHGCTREAEVALNEWGYEVIRCEADEFLKSGGSVRCLILNL
jgi:N-dimethylarginine dimethylaminohydrolase